MKFIIIKTYNEIQSQYFCSIIIDIKTKLPHSA